ncbi:hypothetical protein Pelo_12493 [Pelomyxa schiedti]|nr:hypothetical protein Pelo_12493 [Pelomyxa schiedti]
MMIVGETCPKFSLDSFRDSTTTCGGGAKPKLLPHDVISLKSCERDPGEDIYQATVDVTSPSPRNNVNAAASASAAPDSNQQLVVRDMCVSVLAGEVDALGDLYRFLPDVIQHPILYRNGSPRRDLHKELVLAVIRVVKEEAAKEKGTQEIPYAKEEEEEKTEAFKKCTTLLLQVESSSLPESEKRNLREYLFSIQDDRIKLRCLNSLEAVKVWAKEKRTVWSISGMISVFIKKEKLNLGFVESKSWFSGWVERLLIIEAETAQKIDHLVEEYLAPAAVISLIEELLKSEFPVPIPISLSSISAEGRSCKLLEPPWCIEDAAHGHQRLGAKIAKQLLTTAQQDFTQIVIASINMVRIACYLHKTHIMKTETIYRPESRAVAILRTVYNRLSSLPRRNPNLAFKAAGYFCSDKDVSYQMRPCFDDMPVNQVDLASAIKAILCALKTLHEAEIFHCDIRWANVMRDCEQGHWVLVDLEWAEIERGRPLEHLRAFNNHPGEVSGPESDLLLVGELLVSHHVSASCRTADGNDLSQALIKKAVSVDTALQHRYFTIIPETKPVCNNTPTLAQCQLAVSPTSSAHSNLSKSPATAATAPMTVDDAPANTPSSTAAAANNDNDGAIKCTSTTSKTDEGVLLQVKRSAPGPAQNPKRSSKRPRTDVTLT